MPVRVRSAPGPTVLVDKAYSSAAPPIVRLTTRTTDVPDLTVMTWTPKRLFPVGHADGPSTQQKYNDKVAGLAEGHQRRRA